MSLPTRSEAWDLLCEWIQSDSLRKHALAVEAAVRAYARRFGGDEELWGVTALLHDLDFERFPNMEDPENGHPRTALRLFKERGYPPELIQAVAGHAPYLGIPRTTRLDAALSAVDELTGLVMAVAYVRPSKDIRDVEVSSVKKKWKDKLFAAAVSRADVEQGAAELGVDLWEHVGVVLEAMKGIAAELGLDGRLATRP
jgi:putative nucleotidyltransferase with HDIG domain